MLKYTERMFSYCLLGLVFNLHDNVCATIPGYNCGFVAFV